MKIFLPTISESNTTGKGLFCYRLAKEFKKTGVSVSDDVSQKYDIAMHLIRHKNKVKAKKHIVRLDGVYHDKMINYKSRNAPIKSDLHKNNAVIYQSKFSKKMCNKYLGKFSGPSTIISNGADPKFYDNIVPANMRHTYNFLAASRWRPHKRLKDTIESFLLAGIKDSCLYIAGDLEQSGLSKDNKRKYFKMDNVVYTGVISQKTLGGYLKAVNGFIHLCWFDNCPNSVVEAICVSKPVITNNVGGTHELVSKCGGYICSIDKEYDYKPCKLYKPPTVDRKIIADNIHKCIVNKIKIDNSHVDVMNIAKLYKDFFLKVL
jgi:glycosyltransferase involved in cell wall biosynthesis